jgi:hypothetical protein
MSVEIELTCQPSKEGRLLVFPYQVKNHATVDTYVMHAMPGVEQRGGSGKANPQALVVLHGPDDNVTVGKFIAPSPIDRRIAMPVIPLARHLSPGESLEARIEVPLPFAEASPYFQELLLREYEVVDVRGVVLSIGYWVAGVDGLAAMPVDYAPELFNVLTRNTVRSAKRVSQHFPTRALQLFKRTDEFPRRIPGDPDPTAALAAAGSWTGAIRSAVLA